jgi:LmbE family N-acetylglucosaminyl deacetylase
MRDNTHKPNIVIDHSEPIDPMRTRRRIDVDDPGPTEMAWRAAIDRAALPRWNPGAAGLVLVVSPHPDDETLAVGGLLHDLVAAGWRVRLASVTDGEAAYRAMPGLGAIRRDELSSALDRLGIAHATVTHFLMLPDGYVAQCQAALEARLAPLVTGASWILAPWRHDGHPDHEACGRAAAAVVTRGGGGPIRFFPVWVWHWATTGSSPARRMLASAERRELSRDALHAKRAALRAFTSQQNGAFGPPILPSHVLDRFARPFEVLLR